ncbi:U1 small nuclear ribonucleoprotein C [Taenia crassiceps]|uniref:U1 small nuclear ribonucleoprotein C n=1 Tax=Taenia crassiceps TaxID=6207 RepID=A0ABR4QM07_9CEST
MPKYYCDYCDKFLTHDSPSVRKTHCTGRTHKNSVREYYQKWLEEQVQKLVDHACKVRCPLPCLVVRWVFLLRACQDSRRWALFLLNSLR